MTLLERIRTNNRETEAIQGALEHMSTYYDTKYDEMYEYYHAMKQKSAEKFIEGWVANLLGVKKKDIISYDRKNDIAGLDLGDLVASEILIPGKNNVELKVMFSNGLGIGGGQLRFYEPLAGYLFMKAWSIDNVEYFYLTKDELVSEIKERACTPQLDKKGNTKLDKRTNKPKYYVALGSSQGSGKIKGTNANRLQILQDNIDNKRQDQICWSFNTRSEPILYKKWQEKYCKTPEELTNIFAQMPSR